jgi:hypothetical protein
VRKTLALGWIEALLGLRDRRARFEKKPAKRNRKRG